MERVLAGRYELEALLGRGGSGEVWRGRDMATHRPVAIKIVELAQIDDPGLLAETIGRFRREAMVIAGLRHPNIVGSLDAGRVGSQLFMIEELAPGTSVARMMDDRGLHGAGLFPVSSVLRLAEQASLGLGAAHDAGVVHRDVKPSSLMASPQLDVKIIDFGIARLLADNSPRLLMPGQTVSSAAYLSPEQVQGDEVDGRSDLYSLGCVLYHLLAGRLPFRSALPSALLMMQVMDQATPLAAIRPDLPAGLPELVSELMAKDRADRPRDAAEVVSRIAAIDGRMPAEPAYEADRDAIRAVDPADAAGEALGDGTEPESGRSAVLTPERPVSPWPGGGPRQSPENGSPAHSDTVGVPPWEARPGPGPRQPPSDPRAHPIPAAGWDGPPAPGRGSDPQPAVRGTGGRPPAPARRARRGWLGVLAVLLIVVVAAGVWGYVWHQTRDKLTVSRVTVTAQNSKVGCSGTANLIGTITTNGRAGTISYEWLRSTGATPQVKQVSAVSGNDLVTVTLRWPFHSKGIGTAVAQLRVLTPGAEEGRIYIPFSCSS